MGLISNKFIKVILLFFGLAYCLKLINDPGVYAQVSGIIRVSGYAYGRTSYPIAITNGSTSSSYSDTSVLYTLLKNPSNFGQSGTIKCGITFFPLVQSIVPGSLVDENGNRKIDIFFAGMPSYTTSQDEVTEVKRFLEAGGIFYLSANGSASNDYGLNYNLLFETLGIPDRFGVDQKDFSIQIGTTSTPQESPTVSGPFGHVGAMTHSPFRLIENVTLDNIAGGYGIATDVIVADGYYSHGFVSISGNPLYINYFSDQDNKNYFLNLFALGCNKPNPTPSSDPTTIPIPTSTPLITPLPTSEPTDTPSPEPTVTPTPPTKVINVPSIKQGLSPSNDNNPYWENLLYDHATSQWMWCGTTMYKCACGLTSAAMILAFNEIQTGPDGRPVDPMSINEYFSRNAVQLTNKEGKTYYNSWGYGWGDFNFFKVDDYTNEANKMVSSQPKLDQPVRESYNLERLKAYLDINIPVILKTVPAGGGTHFVVAKGYSGDNIIINDPFFPDPVSGYTTLSQQGYTPSVSENAMTHYVQTHSDFSSFDIYSDSDFLVIDQQGHRLGKDMSLITVYKEIPKSYYEIHEPINDPEGTTLPPVGEGMRFASIQTPSSGRYTVSPIGESGDKFNLDISITNISGDLKRFTFSGVVDRTVPSYTFSFTDQGGGVLDPFVVLIDVLPGIKPNYLLADTWIPVPVAILSDTMINPPNDINSKTVTFGKSGDENSVYFCTSWKDLNKDKRRELMCFINMRKTGLTKTETKGFIKASLNDGATLAGMDGVKIVGK